MWRYIRLHRFGSLALLLGLSVVVFFIVRSALIFKTWPHIDASLGKILQIYSVGFIYDLVLVAYFVTPLIIYLTLLPERIRRHSIHLKIIYIVFYLLIWGLLFDAIAEWFFWNEFGVRFNFISVDYLVYWREIFGNVYESYPVIPLLIALFAVTGLITWALRRFILYTLRVRQPLPSRLAWGAALLSVPLLSLALVDDNLRNISYNHYEKELAGNGIYQFFQAFRYDDLHYSDAYIKRDDAQVLAQLREELRTPHSQYLSRDPQDITRLITSPQPERRLNVILVVIESLSAKYLNALGGQHETSLTPYLDSLVEQSLLFTQVYAAGTRTVRGLEAITLSLPPHPGSSLIKRNNATSFFSIGTVFQSKGYDSQFIYGGHAHFDNMGPFFSQHGFGVVDRNAFSPQEISFENIWGVADEDLYRKVLRQAQQSQQAQKPFFFLVMTTSNHRPFTYPKDKIDIPSGTGGRHGAVRYTDYAIQQFMAQAQQQPWFDDTVFVFVADHGAESSGKMDLSLETFHIPLMVYSPKHVAPGKIHTLASQIDVAPTILDLLHFQYTSRFFGKSIRQTPPEQGRALLANYPKLGFYQGRYLYMLGINQSTIRIDHSLGENDAITPLTADSKELDRMIAYYQGAEFLYRTSVERREKISEAQGLR